jgi:beta-lactamase class A
MITSRHRRVAAIVPLVLAYVCLIGSAGSNPVRAAAGPGEDRLGERIATLVRAIGGEPAVAVAFHDLETGSETLVCADEPFHPASTIKLAVMMEVYRQAVEGRLSLEDRLPVRNEFASIVDGSHYFLKPADDSELGLYKRIGRDATVRELTTLMITKSSNLATNLLVDRVSPGRATATMKRLGADEVVVLRGVEDSQAYARGMNNRATARGLMCILQQLAERKVASEQASAEMLEILRAQTFNEGIPAGLPSGVSVAHKTGSFKGVYHDAAIVEPRRRKPYVLVVLTCGIADEEQAHKLVAKISRVAYQRAVSR